MSKISMEVNCNQIGCPHFETCVKCPTEIHRLNSTNTTDILYVGIGLGEVEEREHRPFRGKAGVRLGLLTKYLLDNVRSFNVAFSNTVRCRPLDNNGKNRAPTDKETEFCLPYLYDDIDELAPRMIVLLGKPAIGAFISDYKDQKFSMRNTHGIIIDRGLNVFLLSYHPAFIIRQHGQRFNPNNLKQYEQIFINDMIKALSYEPKS